MEIAGGRVGVCQKLELIENDWNPGRQLQENLYPHHEYNFSSEKAQYKIN